MDVNVIVCPNCGAKVKINPGSEYATCEYCDSQILVDDGHEKVEYIDQARIKEAELESKRIDELRWERERELEELNKWQKIRNAWLIAIVVLFCAMALFDDNVSTIASRILACVLLFGFIVWGIKPKRTYTVAPERKNSQKGVHHSNRHADDYNTSSSYDESYDERDTRFDPIDNQILDQKLPWYIRTGWIIVIGLFTEGLYWIVGPIIRILWKKNH